MRKEIQKFIEDRAREYADAGNEEGRLNDAYYDTYHDFISGANSVYQHLLELIELKDNEIKRRDKLIEKAFKDYYTIAYPKSEVNKYWKKFKKENNI